MKKSLIILLLLTSMILTACGGGDGDKAGNAGESTIDRVKKAGKLVVGTATGYAPFEMVNLKDEFVGYDIDTAKAIGKALDVKVEFKEYSFDGLIAALQVGEIDMIVSGMTITGPRALSVSFPNPYYQTKQVMLLPDTDTTTKSWKELDKKGKKIATIIGTTGQIFAKANFKNAEFKDYREMPAAALAMLSGQLDAVIYDESSVRIWQKQNGKSHILDENISAENLGIAVAHNDLVTVQWLNSFLYSYLGGPQELASRSYWFESDDWYGDINTKVEAE
ncbi:transporter substrate-binding domain-containing protein [Viridibacillus arvi]|uniref:transporter substrate-binding domain-containing protein n=1 Tax=Viridibacillus arvi TaxID=263475 RepID=UPI00187BB7F8|nr:transporter substrate-binding domain-containing protein [Viridibacillus sp. JNUCC-6]QOV11320.1 transporter substrate-binding domain-containing protein [Viridibacillus sp. JNUCC-6]